MPNEIAKLTLVDIGPVKILAGHDVDEMSVYVLRRVGDAYELHSIDVTKSQEGLRAFLAADQSEHGELVAAICRTFTAADKRRRKVK